MYYVGMMNCLTTVFTEHECLMVNSFMVFSILFYVLQFDIHIIFQEYIIIFLSVGLFNEYASKWTKVHFSLKYNFYFYEYK